jgi:Mce-associated membrane protein
MGTVWLLAWRPRVRDVAADPGDDTVDAEEADAARASAPRRRRGRVLLALAVLVAIAAVAGIAALWTSRADLRSEVDRRDEVASVAGRFAEALLTYDHEDLVASRDAVTDLATDRFAAEYVDAFNAGLGVQIEALEAVSSATVREVFVARFVGNTARAIVIADSEIVSSAGSRGAVGTYLDMTLVRLDGQWRVDDVTSVANAGSRLDPVPGSDADADADADAGAGTTTTSVP